MPKHAHEGGLTNQCICGAKPCRALDEIDDGLRRPPTPSPTPLVVRGRYMIVPEGGDKPKAHTRVTNFAKKLEDGYTLTNWKMRNVLVGAAQRTDIIAATLAANGDKRKLGELAEQALDAAKANVGRETGTALHALTERADAGMELDLPSPLREDIAAYSACMAGLGVTIRRMEEVVVIPDLGLAGRFDRLVDIGGTTYVMDLKTGADLSYSWLSIAIQLAVYAQAETIYHRGMDGDNDDGSPAPHHEPMPAVDQSRAIVVHLPAGQAKATAYWVDLEMGRYGIGLTEKVMAWRKGSKGVAEAIVEPLEAFPGAVEVEPGSMAHVEPLLRPYVVARVQGIIDHGAGADLAARWPLGVPTLKAAADLHETQYDEILAACSAVEALHGMPFPLVSDPRLRDHQPTVNKRKGNK